MYSALKKMLNIIHIISESATNTIVEYTDVYYET